MDRLEVKEVCSTSGEGSHEDDDSFITQREVNDENTVVFDDGRNRKKTVIRTRRELRAEHAAKQEWDRMGIVLPDPVQDRERERSFVHLATKGVVQLFNAVAERQKELKEESAENMTSKKRRLHSISTQSFNRKLKGSKAIKNEADNKKEDWLSDDQIVIKSETEDDANTSGIKTEPESDLE